MTLKAQPSCQTPCEHTMIEKQNVFIFTWTSLLSLLPVLSAEEYPTQLLV